MSSLWVSFFVLFLFMFPFLFIPKSSLVSRGAKSGVKAWILTRIASTAGNEQREKNRRATNVAVDVVLIGVFMCIHNQL